MGGGARESNVQQNPYTMQADAGGWGQLMNFGQMPNYAQDINSRFSSPLYNPLLSPTSFNPQSLVDMGTTMGNEGSKLTGYGDSVMNMGLDPNNQQYAFYEGKMRDAMNAQNANAGLSTTPYGSGVIGQSEAEFANQWALSESQKADAALSAATGAYGTAGQLQNTGANLEMAAPTFQMGALNALTDQTMKNYAFPEQQFQNFLSYMSAANAQNQTSVSSAQQQNAAAKQNSPFSFLGSLMGMGTGGGSTVGGDMMGGMTSLLPLLFL